VSQGRILLDRPDELRPAPTDNQEGRVVVADAVEAVRVYAESARRLRVFAERSKELLAEPVRLNGTADSVGQEGKVIESLAHCPAHVHVPQASGVLFRRTSKRFGFGVIDLAAERAVKVARLALASGERVEACSWPSRVWKDAINHAGLDD
jgi:hypothetical protein